MDLDGLGVDLQASSLVGQEIADDIALVALQLDHLSGLLIADDGAVAGELLLDHLKDLLEVEFGRDSFDGGQCLAAIALLDTDVDICRRHRSV